MIWLQMIRLLLGGRDARARALGCPKHQDQAPPLPLANPADLRADSPRTPTCRSGRSCSPAQATWAPLPTRRRPSRRAESERHPSVRQPSGDGRSAGRLPVPADQASAACKQRHRMTPRQASRPDRPSSGPASQRPPGHRERSDPDPHPDYGSGVLRPSRQVRDVEMTIAKPGSRGHYAPFEVRLPHIEVQLIARWTELAQQVLTHPRLSITS